MTSTTDEETSSCLSPDSATTNDTLQEIVSNGRLHDACPEAQPHRLSPSLSTPVASTPMSFTERRFLSPTSATPGDGLYHRHKRSQSKDLDTARRSLSMTLKTPSPAQAVVPTRTPSPRISPSLLTPKSPSWSPTTTNPSIARSIGRRKKLMFFLTLLLVGSMCVTLSFTFYLMNQIKDDNSSSSKFQRQQTRPQPTFDDQGNQTMDEVFAPKDASFYDINNAHTVYLEQNHGFDGFYRKRRLEDDLTLHAPLGQEALPQDDYDEEQNHDSDCVQISDWQSSSFPNCNMVHELELQAAGPNVGKETSVKSRVGSEDTTMYLGHGWFRDAWQVDVGGVNETVVLKTLRLEREFYSEFYELHRRDAVAMERLTFSPFVMEIYGFCGQSALNEMANFGHGGLTSLEKFDRRLRGKDTAQALFVKLQIATSVAVGVAHVHQVNGADAVPSMVHYDLNPRNIAIVKGGKPKLNDFNTANFLRFNPKTNETCGFPSRLHEPWWRAPEEVVIPEKGEVRLVTEKADVFSLGNLLYHILTSHAPRGKMNKTKRMEIVRADVAKAQPPPLHKMYIHSKDPAVIAFKNAMKMCYIKDPEKRASASEVADVLLEALMDIRRKNPGITKLKK